MKKSTLISLILSFIIQVSAFGEVSIEKQKACDNFKDPETNKICLSVARRIKIQKIQACDKATSASPSKCLLAALSSELTVEDIEYCDESTVLTNSFRSCLYENL